MKSMIKHLWIIVVAAVIGLSMTACGGGSTALTYADFQGKWVHSGVANDPDYDDYSFEFTGDQLQFLDIGANGKLYRALHGTFTFTNTEITFIAPPGTWTGWTQRYTLSKNQLKLEDGTSPYGIAGTFIRQ